MSYALEGEPKRNATLTEQANGRRLCRSMFIGHTAGYLLIFAVIIGALAYFGFTQPVSYDAVLAVTEPPTVLHYGYIGLHPYATLGLAALGFIIWTAAASKQ
jgi:hypothetical protein